MMKISLYSVIGLLSIVNSVSAGGYANGVSKVGYSNGADSGYDANNVDCDEGGKYKGGESSAVHPTNVYAGNVAKPVYRREDEDISDIATDTENIDTEDVDATDAGDESSEDVDATDAGDDSSEDVDATEGGESSEYGGDSDTEDVDPSSTGDDYDGASPTNLTCSEGKYKCVPGKPGFYYQCNFSQFVMRPCGPGTVCVENGDGTIHCGFPKNK
ncbi:hypothetical protein AYI70_g3350 [Smittium culicis]|uniref:Carbohydrate-binding module family 19 domain-containing protein n=1 Tax=Smittium culicis TaxID=133412 RepID=A0A1R1Y4C3_9FUNG|nr:hypothetical protein AYI70_g3350 [Smittium culicis]